MFKAAEILDFKKTRRIIYPGRPLYVRLVRNLTPEKKENHPVAEIQTDPKVRDIAKQIDKNDKLKGNKSTSTSNAAAANPQLLKYKHQKVNPSGLLLKPTK